MNWTECLVLGASKPVSRSPSDSLTLVFGRAGDGYALLDRAGPQPQPSSVLLGKWFIAGRSSVEGVPCCKQRLLYDVTISGLKAIQADPFQGGDQMGQCRAKLPFVLAHQLARV